MAETARRHSVIIVIVLLVYALCGGKVIIMSRYFLYIDLLCQFHAMCEHRVMYYNLSYAPLSAVHASLKM